MKAETLNEYQDRIKAVVEYVLAQREGALRHRDLAKVAGFSEFHFGRIFSGLVGEPLMDVVRRVRLERAADRLRHSDCPVTQIAFEAGFETLEAFCRTFRTAFGASPTGYRRTGGHCQLLQSPSGIHWHPDDRVRTFWPGTRRQRMLQAKIAQVAPKRVAALRHVGENPGIDRSWAELKPQISEQGLDKRETRYFTRFYDDPECVGAENTRSDLMITVDKDFRPFGEVRTDEIPGGEYAVFVHQGEDDLIVDIWARAFSEWLPTSGREFSGVCFEEYVNGFYLRPALPDEKLIVTAVYIGLKPQ